jgi:hypothetical protein
VEVLGKYLSDAFSIQYGLKQKFNIPFQIYSETECEITFFEGWSVDHGHEFPFFVNSGRSKYIIQFIFPEFPD